MKNITVLNYIPNKKEGTSLLAWFDFRVEYTPEKWEIFRQLPYFKGKEGYRGNFITMPSFKRNEIFVKYFERAGIKDLLVEFASKANDYYVAAQYSPVGAPPLAKEMNLNDEVSMLF
jgi:hypothetical protein